MWQNAGRSDIDQWIFIIYITRCRFSGCQRRITKKWCHELSKLPKAILDFAWQALISFCTSATCCRCGLGRDVPHTYHKVISRPNVANSKSVESVLKMRRANGQPRIYNNSDRGYIWHDNITGWQENCRFYYSWKRDSNRIDSQGNIMIKEAAQRKKSSGRTYQSC